MAHINEDIFILGVFQIVKDCPNYSNIVFVIKKKTDFRITVSQIVVLTKPIEDLSLILEVHKALSCQPCEFSIANLVVLNLYRVISRIDLAPDIGKLGKKGI